MLSFVSTSHYYFKVTLIFFVAIVLYGCSLKVMFGLLEMTALAASEFGLAREV